MYMTKNDAVYEVTQQMKTQLLVYVCQLAKTGV